MSRKGLLRSTLKSQLAGFFAFIFLTSCQPARISENELMQQAKTDTAAAMQLANFRLAKNESQAALQWLQQAAILGDTHALTHALLLHVRLEGKLAAANWFNNRVTEGSFLRTDIDLPLRGTLGLWDAPFRVANSAFVHPKACSISLQPVATNQAGINNWLHLLDSWRKNSDLAALPVCFLELKVIDSTVLSCTEDSLSLINCHYLSLEKLVASPNFTQLVIVSGKGLASYNNGILQLPESASFSLFKHEFMHVLGFIDEYKLPEHVANEVCKEGANHPNILLSNELDNYVDKWKLSREEIVLSAVDTCKNLAKQAYRIVSEDNLMRSYELGLPKLYLKQAQHILKSPEQLMPVQYYFAYLARQQQDWVKWRLYMQHASAFGYQHAQEALAY